jgi:Septum formation
MFSGRRLLPPTIAVVLIAVVSVVIWLANRSAPIPTKPPASAPAVGSCWNVDGAAIGGQMPWPGAPLACTAPHTAEVSAVGQVDAKLVRNAQRAKGQNAEVNSFLMTAAARARCSDKTGIYVGAAWRGAQLTVYPDFIAPAKNGFFACVVAQVADPGGTRLVTRTASLAGALNGSGATSLSIDCVAPTTASGAGSSTSADDQLEFVDCGKPHTAEFIALYTVTPAGAPYNGPAIKNAVTSGCQQLVDSFIGLSPGQQRTDLRVSEVGPDSANLWAGSDQSFACYASAQTPWTGSLKGLGTRPLPH